MEPWGVILKKMLFGLIFLCTGQFVFAANTMNCGQNTCILRCEGRSDVLLGNAGGQYANLSQAAIDNLCKNPSGGLATPAGVSPRKARGAR